MKGHDGICFALVIFLSFEMVQLYHMKQLAALTNEKIMLNACLDTAIESAAYGNFDIIDGNIKWNRDKVVDAFFLEVGRLLSLSETDFPVFLIRQGQEAYFYSDGDWHICRLTSDGEQNSYILKETMERLIGQSTVSENSGMVPAVYLPADKESDYANPVGEYGIFAVMQVRSSLLRSSNIYIVSGSCVLGTMM